MANNSKNATFWTRGCALRSGFMAIIIGLMMASGLGSEAGEIGPVCETDLNDDEHLEKLYQISNTFVGDPNHFRDLTSHYKNRLYISDGSTGETTVFEFSGLAFKLLVSHVKQGHVPPFHDSWPDVLIFIENELRYVINYSPGEDKYKSQEVRIQEISAENIQSELKGQRLKSFLSDYQGKEEIFPFHYRKATVRAFSDETGLRYFLYTEPGTLASKWYRVNYRGPR